MFHGGTNFGFMNGSNYYDNLTPDVTSYDYDAPLSEDGQLTDKYEAFREIIARHRDFRSVPLSTDIRRKAYGALTPSGKVSLWHTLDKLTVPVSSAYPQSMEQLGQGYGYILYRMQIHEPQGVTEVKLEGANDRAIAFMDGQRLFTAYDRELLTPVKLNEAAGGKQLDLLLENMGRVNYGSRIESQRKGIAGGVQLNGHRHFGYSMYTLPLDEEQLNGIDWGAGYEAGQPAFYRFELDVDEACDTYVDFEGFGKGCIFINGFNLGRYWEIGPQKRLYLPAPLLKKGRNTLIVFETEGKAAEHLTLRDQPDLG